MWHNSRNAFTQLDLNESNAGKIKVEDRIYAEAT